MNIVGIKNREKIAFLEGVLDGMAQMNTIDLSGISAMGKIRNSQEKTVAMNMVRGKLKKLKAASNENQAVNFLEKRL